MPAQAMSRAFRPFHEAEHDLDYTKLAMRLRAVLASQEYEQIAHHTWALFRQSRARLAVGKGRRTCPQLRAWRT